MDGWMIWAGVRRGFSALGGLSIFIWYMVYGIRYRNWSDYGASQRVGGGGDKRTLREKEFE